jgi:hypothetical protein
VVGQRAGGYRKVMYCVGQASVSGGFSATRTHRACASAGDGWKGTIVLQAITIVIWKTAQR